MIRICDWLARLLCRLLDPAERDAVRGDLAESGVTGGRALREVLGLVARRQAGLWNDWQPWLALLGIAAPFGVLLSQFSSSLSGISAIYLWMYWDNGRVADLETPGVRRMLAGDLEGFALMALALIAWSWTSGFALGTLSRRTLWINASLFGLALLAPLAYVPSGTTLGRHTFNAPVFALGFYSVVWPRIGQFALVLLPAIWGVRRAHRRGALRLPSALVWAVVVGTLTELHPSIWAGSPVRPLLLLRVLLTWPAMYLVVTARRRRATA